MNQLTEAPFMEHCPGGWSGICSCPGLCFSGEVAGTVAGCALGLFPLSMAKVPIQNCLLSIVRHAVCSGFDNVPLACGCTCPATLHPLLRKHLYVLYRLLFYFYSTLLHSILFYNVTHPRQRWLCTAALAPPHTKPVQAQANSEDLPCS